MVSDTLVAIKIGGWYYIWDNANQSYVGTKGENNLLQRKRFKTKVGAEKLILQIDSVKLHNTFKEKF